MPDTITLLATPAAVIALVTLAKQFGIEGRWATLLALILGVGLALADHYLGGAAAYAAAVDGVVLGLSAAGLWDLTGRVRQPDPRHAMWDLDED